MPESSSAALWDRARAGAPTTTSPPRSAALDGLGPVGGGAHAEDEHVVLSEMAMRAALLAELIASL